MQSIWNWVLRHKTEIGVFVGTLAIACVLFSFTALKYPNDDQFILFRYIDNIAEGKGFVYNENERVLGSTTPLFTLIASAAKVLTPVIDTPELVAYLNMLFLAGSAVFFYLLARRFLSVPVSLIAVGVFALNLARTIPEGMETPLFLLTALGFLHYLFSGKHYVASVFLGLAILTRPDAGLIGVLAFIYWWHSKGFVHAIKFSAAVGVVLLPWLIFATVYFGSFIPQSLATKLHSDEIYNLPALQATKIQAAHISRIYWGKFVDPENIPVQMTVNLLPALLLAGIGAWRMFLKERGAWILLAIPILYFASFAISNPIIFPWYLSEMEPFWILLSVAGGAFLVERFAKQIGVALLALVLLVGPAYYWVSTTFTEERGSKTTAFEFGSYIKEHQKTGDTVGLADIGIVGYVTNAYIIDFIGLVRESSVSYYPVVDSCAPPDALYTIPPQLIQDSRPTWLVAGIGQMDPCFLKSEWFAANYTFAHGTPTAGVWRLNEALSR